MSGMAYKISFTALLYITVVSSVEDNQSSLKPILKSTSEAGLLPTVKYFSTPPPQYTASTPPQQGNIIIYGQPPLQPATYIPRQASTVQPKRIPLLSLFIQQPAPVLQAASIFQQAARILQPAPVLQYAVRIAVPQPVLVEQNLIQPEDVLQTNFRIVPQQEQGVSHLSPASPQLVLVTSQPQQGIQYAEEDNTNILKYNEAVPVRVKPEDAGQTLQNNRIVPQLQQEQGVIHLSPASPQPVQVTSQQQGIQYAEEDDKNVVKYNEAVTAVPIQVKTEGEALQYFRSTPQLHPSSASPQPVRVTSQPQPSIQYAKKDYKNVKYNEIVTAASVKAKPEDFDDNPQYTYGYDIEDTSTGDSKQQSEERIGNVVRGSYSVVDPDGYRRTVEYTVDANGFSAMVKRKPVQEGVAKY